MVHLEDGASSDADGLRSLDLMVVEEVRRRPLMPAALLGVPAGVEVVSSGVDGLVATSTLST